jgi:predicted RNA-binding Zn-ribbon protein involved in translation (DUF1610 family)
MSEYCGCHGCGEEVIPRIVGGIKHCPECGSENIVELNEENKVTAKIIGIPLEEELDVKRFYIPGVIIQDNCPNCGVETRYDMGGLHYLSHPIANKPMQFTMYCNECDHEWSIKIILRIGLEISHGENI